uniref:Uncharacterized protein n=1 Tax=Rhizophora mucronata TaxID=61149 RepID=A0A2P2NA77_RHIMU
MVSLTLSGAPAGGWPCSTRNGAL